MEILEFMKARHSVRQYLDREIEPEKRAALDDLAEECNRESGLHIQVIYDEPECFGSFMAHYGKISGVANYIAIIGRKSADLDELAGYYGERLVLGAQALGLNTCWVALTHGKSRAAIEKGEKLAVIIALGYGCTQGVPHKSKPLTEVCDAPENAPEWFKKGMEAVLLAPTALNQQHFRFSLKDDMVRAVSTGGLCSKMDLGIVKYHFEAVTGRKVE